MIFVWITLALLALFLAVVLVRGALFSPVKEISDESQPLELDREKIVNDMADMIRCRTVSSREESLIEWEEFHAFVALLEERFPLIHKACRFEKIGKTGLLYCLKGKSSENPTVCMAHYDVVPADPTEWEHPPFSGLLENGVLWGRGTLDTKGTLCGLMEALEQMLASGYVPQNDLYLSFSGEEEIDGSTCAEIVTHLENLGVKPALVLDEGGAVVDNVFPGVAAPCAMVGVGEKGGMNVDLVISSNGGHASTPPPHTALGRLSRAVTRIEKNPFPRQLTPPVEGMFQILGRHSSFLYRVIFANLWCFMPLLDLICKKSGGELNAMVRTTVAVTRMEGSSAYNVLPSKATCGINLRLLGKDTVESAQAYLRRVIKDDAIECRLVYGTAPSPCSQTACDSWDTVCKAIRQTWPEAIVSPYLMMACSDSRHFCRISDRVYRFSAMHLSKEERGMIHGANERIPVETLFRVVEFYTRLLKMV